MMIIIGMSIAGTIGWIAWEMRAARIAAQGETISEVDRQEAILFAEEMHDRIMQEMHEWDADMVQAIALIESIEDE